MKYFPAPGSRLISSLAAAEECGNTHFNSIQHTKCWGFIDSSSSRHTGSHHLYGHIKHSN